MLKKLFGLSGFKIALLITGLLLVHFFSVMLGFNEHSFVSLLDKKVVDFVQAARTPGGVDSPVVIAAIDTKSVDKYGRWPWPRARMAELLKQLREYYGAKVVGFDIVFSEPDPNDVTTAEVLKHYSQEVKTLNPNSKEHLKQVDRIYQKLADDLSNDSNFGKELAQTPGVVNGYFFFANLERLGHLTQAELSKSAKMIEGSAIKVIHGMNHLEFAPVYQVGAVESNIAQLSPKGSQAGYFNVFPDPEDGTVRRVHLVLQYGEQYYPSLDLQILRRYYDDAPIKMLVNESGIEAFLVGEQRIDTASDGSVMINYRGPAFTFPNYSVWDLINRKVDKDALRDKIVLLGATEVGVFDLRTSPVGVDFPGVEVHANLLDNLIYGDYFYLSDFTQVLTLAVVLVLGLFLGLVLPRLRALPGALLVLVLGGGFFYANYWSVENNQTWISFVYVLLTILLNWLGIMLFQYFGEEKDKRFIKGAFGQYLSPEIIEELVKNPKSLQLGGEQREITAFFSDVQGFSTISEALTPKELVELLNEYLTVMTDIIMRHGGTVDKFEGDAIIAFFGAPVVQADHALRCALASLEMQTRLGEMRAQWEKEARPELYMRIGINSDVAVVGNMGSAQRMDYTMMGDGVNLAARLEGVNKQYKCFTMISQNTKEAIGDACETRELDLIRVVGKSEPIRIYELIAPKGQLNEEIAKRNKYFAKALKLYRAQDWTEAAKYFSHCAKQGDPTGQVFLDRCKQFLKSPPPKNWDGVYQMTSK